MDRIVYPDAEKWLVTLLRSAQITPVFVVAPTQRPVRFVKLTRTGGSDHNLAVDRAQITIDMWDETTVKALTLANRIRTELKAAQGKTYYGFTCTGVQLIGGPSLFPDPEIKQARYRMNYAIYLRNLKEK